MIVEFIGTPGAGKTTLVPVVREHFCSLGLEARSVAEAARPFARRTLPGKAVGLLAPSSAREPLLWQVFYHLSKLYRRRFFARNRELMRTVLRFQRRRPIAEIDRQHVLHWFLHHAGRYEFLGAHASPQEVLVFDEGFVHRVVQLFASEVEDPEPDAVRAYLDLVPRPDVVIFPFASVEECERRVYRRGLWERFQTKSPAEVSRYLANAHAVVSLAVAHLEASGWTVVAADNSGSDPAAAKEALRRGLSRLYALPAGVAQLEQRV